MSTQTTTAQGGIGFFGLLFFVFLVLKLTGFVQWSWWAVTAPLWAPTACAVAFILLFLLIGFAVAVLKK